MKTFVLALSMMMSAGAFAQGGPGHAPVNTVAPFDGNFAPGFGPDAQPAANRDVVCGARTPCPQAPQADRGCIEGAQALVTLPSGAFHSREEVTGTAIFVCHDGEWIQAN